jgi:hypothetical protein
MILLKLDRKIFIAFNPCKWVESWGCLSGSIGTTSSGRGRDSTWSFKDFILALPMNQLYMNLQKPLHIASSLT